MHKVPALRRVQRFHFPEDNLGARLKLVLRTAKKDFVETWRDEKRQEGLCRALNELEMSEQNRKIGEKTNGAMHESMETEQMEVEGE